MSEFEIGEIDRRLACLIQAGVVSAVDHAARRCRVSVGDWTSLPIPWLSFAAGEVRSWRPPSVGEQALIVAPSGELATAFAIVGYYTQQHDAPESSPDKTVTVFPDGARESYDHASSEYVLDVPAGGRIVFRIGDTQLVMEAGSTTLTTPSFTGETPAATFTGATTVEKMLTFNGGMTGKGGDGGATMEIVGAATFSDEVTAGGIPLTKHSHMEQGDGAPVGPPIKQ